LEDTDPSWYRDAVVYQLHVRAFQDSNADGTGDFAGLARRLDYVRDLGITAIWLQPFYPSPLRDDGYDIADYEGIHPSYGTMADFKLFLREAKDRGLRVITELVVNHTSDQHGWFQRARRAPRGSRARDFYVWSDDTERYKDARIIFKDFENSNWSWDPVARQYYWHRFYSHQPDLNYANPTVRRAIRRVTSRWLGMGVDGLRLDAVPYLHEKDGTSCENLPDTHEELRLLRRHLDESFPGRMLLAEANQWPEDAAAYFGKGDECHMAFHFPLMPRMFMAVRMEDRYPIVDILSQTPAIPEGCQWAIFLRNHDELTLEMVTDEERDYMYRVYASDARARINLGIRRRLAPLMGNDRRRVELLNGLLFSMPGTPIVYYGDEIGMGDNIYLGDRNGVRTPMQWSPDRNAGFSGANPQQLYLPVIIDPVYSYETVNVEAQHDNPNSLLWWMRRLIALRKRYRCFGRGSLEFLHPENRKVLAYVRRFEGERVLVVANLSRHMQCADLDLSAFRGSTPLELFGQTPLPPVGDRPYFLTLAPYGFYWLSLEARRDDAAEGTAGRTSVLPRIPVAPRWEAVFKGRGRAVLEEALAAFLPARRWFGGKARGLRAVQVAETIELAAGQRTDQILLLHVEYREGEPETYVLPLAMAPAGEMQRLRAEGAALLATVGAKTDEAVIYEPLRDRTFALALLELATRRKRAAGNRGALVGVPGRRLRDALEPEGGLEPLVAAGEQSNTTILYGRRLILKLLRKVEPGTHPELEIGAFLTDEVGFPNVAPVLGSVEYRPEKGDATVVGILFGFVPNAGDAWRFTTDSLSRYFERVQALPEKDNQPPRLPASLLELSAGEITPLAHQLVGTYLEEARLLGQRVGELHVALASRPEDPDFAEEPFTPVYQRSLYQSMRNLTEEVFHTLRRRLAHLPEPVAGRARAVVDRQPEVLKRFRSVLDRKMTGTRIRHHGDLHLGQVLWTGRDFVIIDFEGEPARALSTRRIKRSPLRDAAGVIRSYHYAAFHALVEAQNRGVVAPGEVARFEGWADYWFGWVSSAFLRAYVRATSGRAFAPGSPEELQSQLSVFLLEKAVYELGYELNSRPDWVHLPLRGIPQLLEASR
jgi:maltose alpha-D-glucosyltransferase/alpha-amylase